MESKKLKARTDGIHAEQKAKQFLISSGLHFIQQNFTVTVGEIDLIFMDQNQLVFVEVKYRSDNSHGSAAEAFSASKRAKLLRAIYFYLNEQNLNIHHTNMRIDLIAIDKNALNWIKNV